MAEGGPRLPVLPSCLYHSSPSLLKWRVQISVLVVFIALTTKYFTPLPTCLNGFWRELNVILLFILYRYDFFFNSGFFQDYFFVFSFLQFEYDVSRCVLALSCLVFSDFSGSLFCCLTLTWGNFQSLLLQILLLLFLVFLLWIWCTVF